MLILRQLMLISLLFLTACTSLPLYMNKIEPIAIKTVGNIQNPPVYAVTADGNLVAIAQNALVFKSLSDDHVQVVDSRLPSKLAWSPDGMNLAAYFTDVEANGSICCFSRDGRLISTVIVSESVDTLMWRTDNKLLAVTHFSKNHRFGVSVQQLLIQLENGAVTSRQVLHDTTVSPYYFKKFGLKHLLGRITPKLSPLGDELLYSALFSPPVFTPYLQLRVRNLESSKETVIDKIAMNSRDAVFSSDGESVLWIDEEGKKWLRTLWDDSLDVQFLKNSMATPDMPLLGNAIYKKGEILAKLPDDSLLTPFSESGFLIAWNGILYRLDFVGERKTEQKNIKPAQREKLIKLRSWRASTLISNSEYKNAKQRIMENND